MTTRTNEDAAEHLRGITPQRSTGSYSYAGYDSSDDPHTYRTNEDTMAKTTSYQIKTGPEHHSGERPWMRLASTVTVNCKTVGESCSYEAVTTSPEELEAALEADDDVIEYHAPHDLDPRCGCDACYAGNLQLLGRDG